MNLYIITLINLKIICIKIVLFYSLFLYINKYIVRESIGPITRQRTRNSTVWASGTCPWLRKSAMSYTPTYRTPWAGADPNRNALCTAPACGICMRSPSLIENEKTSEVRKRERAKKEQKEITSSSQDESCSKETDCGMILTRRVYTNREGAISMRFRSFDPVFFPLKVLIEYIGIFFYYITSNALVSKILFISIRNKSHNLIYTYKFIHIIEILWLSFTFDFSFK